MKKIIKYVTQENLIDLESDISLQNTLVLFIACMVISFLGATLIYLLS